MWIANRYAFVPKTGYSQIQWFIAIYHQCPHLINTRVSPISKLQAPSNALPSSASFWCKKHWKFPRTVPSDSRILRASNFGAQGKHIALVLQHDHSLRHWKDSVTMVGFIPVVWPPNGKRLHKCWKATWKPVSKMICIHGRFLHINVNVSRRVSFFGVSSS